MRDRQTTRILNSAAYCNRHKLSVQAVPARGARRLLAGSRLLAKLVQAAAAARSLCHREGLAVHVVVAPKVAWQGGRLARPAPGLLPAALLHGRFAHLALELVEHLGLGLLGLLNVVQLLVHRDLHLFDACKPALRVLLLVLLGRRILASEQELGRLVQFRLLVVERIRRRATLRGRVLAHRLLDVTEHVRVDVTPLRLLGEGRVEHGGHVAGFLLARLGPRLLLRVDLALRLQRYATRALPIPLQRAHRLKGR
mmetsp:Transcript_6618/g.17230  ORF Transcript_6618/g.17230 Transcript_6618/m.17230 type:complete len:254 (-) Transcript_6618:143-904(-)